MDWGRILTTTRQARWPSERLIEWMAVRYGDVPDRYSIKVLDIGPGRHAPNTYALTLEGYDVEAIDVAPGALAHLHLDICTSDLFSDSTFDVVLDVNTLCHVEDAPIAAIYRWLKPGGRFFSIAPHKQTSTDHLKGKGFCRLLAAEELASFLQPFQNIAYGTQSYALPNRSYRRSWIIEATK